MTAFLRFHAQWEFGYTDNEKDFYKAIIYYISGMTDNFAVEIYNEIIHF